MAMTAYENNYDFHEETLYDVMQLVTNNTTRTLLHNELVYLDGFFGEVCEIDGIAAGQTGYISINPNRTIRSAQVADVALMAGDFTIGSTMYFIPQVNANEGYLVDQNDVGAPAIPVGIIVAADADNDWVTCRPFPQPRDVLALSAAIDTLNDDVDTAGSVLKLVKDNAKTATFTPTGTIAATTIATAIAEVSGDVTTLNGAVGAAGSVLKMINDEAEDAVFTPTGDIAAVTIKGAIAEVGLDVTRLKVNPANIVELSVGADATGLGLTFTNATTGLAVGDRIVDLWVVCTESNGSGSLKLSHGDAGADISAALACVTIDVLTRGALIVGGVVTADGLTIIANGAADRGKMYLTYIKA